MRIQNLRSNALLAPVGASGRDPGDDEAGVAISVTADDFIWTW